MRRFYDAGDRPSGLATLLGLDVVPAGQLDRTALVLDLLAEGLSGSADRCCASASCCEGWYPPVSPATVTSPKPGKLLSRT